MPEKRSGVTVLVSSQTAVKGGLDFEIAVGMKNLLSGDWDKIQKNRPSCSDQAYFRCFMCLISPKQKFRLGKSTKSTK